MYYKTLIKIEQELEKQKRIKEYMKKDKLTCQRTSYTHIIS